MCLVFARGAGKEPSLVQGRDMFGEREFVLTDIFWLIQRLVTVHIIGYKENKNDIRLRRCQCLPLPAMDSPTNDDPLGPAQ